MEASSRGCEYQRFGINNSYQLKPAMVDCFGFSAESTRGFAIPACRQAGSVYGGKFAIAQFALRARVSQIWLTPVRCAPVT